ncbi:coiled-coil domain-containing protein 187 isoform X1 [Scophthalmus maximus]|uniref:coiled-coil domain-containing protein 187 isoform X1 n=1 Tax=Scophthalmus maximus TaxID=52904 RepID=UPI001FA88773|nr:coiled-coil domain-containing protein 187 isoform X1 [Scophthalmus maximus]XP_047186840.1 coiled-coil domain-containing protein 187 isoform X1 [Scophthalmus maximus]
MNLQTSHLFPSSIPAHTASAAMRQCFAVLEDGVLAHSLQEQEIEQYYTTNVQKNQLVQNDIRVAKRLQDEEDEERSQQSAVVRQASRQLEEQDFEFARVVQEQIQQRAEETRRRELDDEEIAKRLQEEEEKRIRGRSRVQDGDSEGSAGGSALPSPRQHQSSCPTTRWQYSTSHSWSDLTGTGSVSAGGPAAQRRTTSRWNQRRTDSIREIREEPSESLSSDSQDSDTVFSEQQNKRVNTAPPPQRRVSLRHPSERSYRSLFSRSSSLNQERGEWDEGYIYYDNEGYDGEKRRHRNQDQDGSRREESEGRCGSRDSRSSEVRERRCSRSESVRSHDRSRDLARTWSNRDNPDKHVRFQEDARRSNSSRVWEMLGQVLRERGVPVTLGGGGAPLQIRPQSRESQVLHGSEESHQRVFHRAVATRHSFHGDIRKRRRSSRRENSGRDQRDDGNGHCDDDDEEEVYEINRRESYLANGDGRGGRRWRDEDVRESRAQGHRVKRSTSERRPRHKSVEQRSSSEEERQEAERRAEWPPRRAAQRSQSLSSSSSRSGHVAAGVSLQPDPRQSSLDLGELTQVLQDEELARKLQDEEEMLLRSNSRPPPPPPRSFYPEGDFRVAQVAQDEEIARFMQKQEIKSKRRSRELEGPSSWREHREMIGHHDRRAARDRQVQRERLDSEGLPSPTEDCCPENLPPSPVSTLPPAQHIRNIAEELDPTFQARRQDTERRHQVEQTGPACQSLAGSHAGLNDFLVEPTFIPPTKRQAEKPAGTKPKEKKENCKQQ